jgi:hypothetical protein
MLLYLQKKVFILGPHKLECFSLAGLSSLSNVRKYGQELTLRGAPKRCSPLVEKGFFTLTLELNSVTSMVEM